MSIYRARLRNTSNALSPRVSSEQIRLQVPPKLFGVDSWIKVSRVGRVSRIRVTLTVTVRVSRVSVIWLVSGIALTKYRCE